MSYKNQIFLVAFGLVASLVLGYYTSLLLVLVLPLSYLVYFSFFVFQSSDKNRLILFLTSLLCYLITFADGAFLDVIGRLILDCLLYFFVSVYLIQSRNWKLSLRQIICALFVPKLLSCIPFFIDADEYFKPVMIDFIIPSIAVFIVQKLKRKIIFSLAFTALILLVAFFAYPNYMQAVSGKTLSLNDDRITLPFTNNNGDTLSVNNMGSKVVILDTWYTGCNICFQKFPLLESLADRYRNDSNILIAALNIPLENERNDTKGFDLVSEYRFQAFKAISNISENLWRINAYPTVLIFDKNHVLRYTGQIEIDNQFLVNNTLDLIEKLRTEQLR